MSKFRAQDYVYLLTGKYQGFEGIVVCYTEPHPQSSHKRLQIKVQTGLGWKTLLVNEDNMEPYEWAGENLS
jgi:hypothetical protein